MNRRTLKRGAWCVGLALSTAAIAACGSSSSSSSSASGSIKGWSLAQPSDASMGAQFEKLWHTS